MAQRKVFVCDRCGKQTPDDRITRVCVDGERVFDGVESYNREHRGGVGCVGVALRDLIERYEKATRGDDGHPAVEWLQAHGGD